MYRWIINGKLAVSRMPYPHEIPELASIFDSVVILIEPHEYPGMSIQNYIRQWRSYGVEIYYNPTRDWWPPHLLELYNIVKWIKSRLDYGHKVLVHCMGGIGRSGTVAAAYLVYAHNYTPWDAVIRVRKKIPGALEVARQEKMVYDLYSLLKFLPKPYLDKIVGLASKYDYGAGIKHASKVTQLSVELLSDLDIVRELSRESKMATTASAIVHEIIKCDCVKSEESLKILRSGNIDDFLSSLIIDTLAQYCSLDYREDIGLNASILAISDYLDYTRDQSVDYIEYDTLEGSSVIRVYCEFDCSKNIMKAKEVRRFLETCIGTKIEISLAYSG
ncbi:hypothetical protein DRJ17_06740 [Candidatus Woesearchaeota archaeon]|nr:MAG: hypothetical protein DRJ17_06740 [Candidatus Woesearchaeota archaeon]